MTHKYWKAPDGAIWGGNSIIYDGRIVINPNRERLLAAGYVEEEYVAPEPTLEDNKRDVLRKLDQYVLDTVERITVNGTGLWIERERRAEINRLLDALARQGVPSVTVWLSDELCIDAKVAAIRSMMDDVAVYANDADSVTRRHRAEINKSETADEVAAYDITGGYPDKLTFNL